MIINIHTHAEVKAPSAVLSILNIRMGRNSDIVSDDGWFSAGLHPWDSDSVDFNPDILEQMISRPNVLAAGECGLDRLRGADIGSQTTLFKRQALIAEARQKPVIIHCVQAWQEIMALKKELHPQVSWIIHGFRGKPELATQLINHGFYLSFGGNILESGQPAAASLKQAPVSKIFMETDVSPVPIEEIYQAAAEIKNLSLEQLQTLILQNFTRVFGNHGTSGMASAD